MPRRSLRPSSPLKSRARETRAARPLRRRIHRGRRRRSPRRSMGRIESPTQRRPPSAQESHRIRGLATSRPAQARRAAVSFRLRYRRTRPECSSQTGGQCSSWSSSSTPKRDTNALLAIPWQMDATSSRCGVIFRLWAPRARSRLVGTHARGPQVVHRAQQREERNPEDQRHPKRLIEEGRQEH
jgi:hypothetical protein